MGNGMLEIECTLSHGHIAMGYGTLEMICTLSHGHIAMVLVPSMLCPMGISEWSMVPPKCHVHRRMGVLKQSLVQ